MHFEILVEDQSGKDALDLLVPKIIGNNHTYKIRAYKGIGHIPKNLNTAVDASKRKLLANLPKLLSGYGKSWPTGYPAVVIIICDLDDKCLKSFRQELLAILSQCHPAPETRFCLAVEEGEAWLLGDIAAIKSAYPAAKNAILGNYINDAVCGTWEVLADAIYKGGAQALSASGGHRIGAEKSAWAKSIAPHMDITNNQSPSFNYFRNKLLEFAEQDIAD